MRSISLAGALIFLIPATAAAAPAIDLVTTIAPSGKKPTRVIVEAADPGARPVNGVRVERAGGGAFAESACGVRADGSYTPPGGVFVVPVPGEPTGDVRVSVTASSCAPDAPAPETTSEGFALRLPQPGEVLPLLPFPEPPRLPGVPLARAAAACKDVDLGIVGRTRKLVRKAIVCLVNRHRLAAGARRVRNDMRLQKAAAAHAGDMRRRRYFAHEGPGGPDLAARLARARFWPATAGENLAAGTAPLSTARVVVDAWMQSAPHRANMLDKRFTRVGIGIEPSFPDPPTTPGGTVAAAFGKRG